MALTLITGPHQSGKSRRLWELLRAEPPGSAVLVRPSGLTRDLVRQVHAWGGPGWLPPVLTLPELAERAAAALGDAPGILTDAWIRHALRRWAVDGLAGTGWATLAPYRRTARELAELVQRLDAQGVGDEDLTLALASLDERLGDQVRTLRSARRWLQATAARRQAATPGARWAALHAAPVPWAPIYLDDVLALTPVEAAWLAALSATRRVVVAAVADDRCPGGLVERLRIAVPGATEERFAEIHPMAPHAPGLRAVLAGILPPGGEAPPLSSAARAALGHYRYRDPVHAGRALAAWLRARQVPASQVNLYVRIADNAALTLADALRAAGVPVAGRFSVAYGATSAGATIAALGSWLAQPTWPRFRDLALRLDLGTPIPLLDLAGPWLGVADAFAALEALASTGVHGDLGIAKPLRPGLTATVARLRDLYASLPTSGTWFARFTAAAELLALPIAPVVATLAALDALHPVDADDLIDALANHAVEVARDDGPDALLILDAVRGRSQPRAVAVLHGLEHGSWPPRPATGILIAADDRARIAGASGRDWFDEAGRTAGEIAALLACVARGLTTLVVGIPCGERQPSAWLATIAEQAAWDLDQLRSQPDGEAVAGAPLGPEDSQGPAEQALWQGPRRTSTLAFRVPPQAPADLGVRISTLDRAIGDTFAFVCDRLALGDVLQDRTALDDGNELHELLKTLARHSPATWTTVVEDLLEAWFADAPDPLTQAARRRRAPVLRTIVAKEAEVVAGARVDPERALPVDLDLGDLGILTLKGRADRIDHLPDGTAAVVDYKRGRNERYRGLIKEQREAQVTAYLMALRQSGLPISGGAFVTLADGKRVAVDLEGLDSRWAAVTAGIGALARGNATARADGACPPTVIRVAELGVAAPAEEPEV